MFITGGVWCTSNSVSEATEAELLLGAVSEDDGIGEDIAKEFSLCVNSVSFSASV